MDAELPDFTGQSVVFYTSKSDAPDWMDEGTTLESPALQKHGDRWFVVGRTPKSSDEDPSWFNDRMAAIAWDVVHYYVVVPTDEYEAYWNEHSDEVENDTPLEA